MEASQRQAIDNYPAVLEPKHVKEILGIGEKQTYELLNQVPPPFHYVRVGRLIKIPKESFAKWLYGNDTPIDTNYDTKIEINRESYRKK